METSVLNPITMSETEGGVGSIEVKGLVYSSSLEQKELGYCQDVAPKELWYFSFNTLMDLCHSGSQNLRKTWKDFTKTEIYRDISDIDPSAFLKMETINGLIRSKYY